MYMDKNDLAGDEGRDVALKFLQAIHNGDAGAFWNLLDRKGQGYFIGMWFMALADADIKTIEGLTGEGTFLSGALRPILENLKSNLGTLLECTSFGNMEFIDGHHARVPLMDVPGEEEQGAPFRKEYVPLVLELAPADNRHTALTCWKVDTFECIQFGKA